jgi:hypothetical protein
MDPNSAGRRPENFGARTDANLFAKMMEKAEGRDAVADLIDERGYICQVQQVLEATAEFRLQADEGSTMNIETGKLGEIKDRVKAASITAALAA